MTAASATSAAVGAVAVGVLSLGPSCDLEGAALSLAASRCSGDEYAGELLFLLCASFPPRDELRGDTRPV